MLPYDINFVYVITVNKTALSHVGRKSPPRQWHKSDLYN